MIDTVLNLLFRCPHRRITRPITPVTKGGQPHGQTYVVCLDCGKQFTYDVMKMRIGKPVGLSQTEGVLHHDMPKPKTSKLRYALWAAVPVAWVLGSTLQSKKTADKKKTGQDEPAPPAEPGEPRP